MGFYLITPKIVNVILAKFIFSVKISYPQASSMYLKTIT